ncbi:TPA: hypothetical protein GXZ34_01340 [bacterium]|nr:hypothetical protein [bacterium]
MNRKIIIFGSSMQRANNKLQSILDNMRVGDIEQVRKGYNNFTVQLKNGDIYIAKTASESCRGYKWQYAYIDALINEDLLYTVILPNFIPKDENGDWIMDEYIDVKNHIEWF